MRCLGTNGVRCKVTLQLNSRTELITWFCALHLKDYHNLFGSESEISGLNDVSRRYSWLKRLLKGFDEHHTPLFPASWKVAENMTHKFCIDTRTSVIAALDVEDQKPDFDNVAMLSALEVTIDFESKLALRFHSSVKIYHLGTLQEHWKYFYTCCCTVRFKILQDYILWI